ncbi:MAG: alpha/beta hydrolase family protein [Gammaproteobacteria bacterium]
MQSEHQSIEVDDYHTISSTWLFPNDFDYALIIAHGAGQGMDSPFLSALHEGFAQRGLLSVKFNFPYFEQGRKAPDRAPVLFATWKAVIESVKARFGLENDKIFLSGKSMGGRYASMLAAEQIGFAGLILFGYPLHPAGKTDRLRSEHLADIGCPVLFLQGTRDSLCKLELLRPVLANLSRQPDLYIIEGGDHSFKVPKSSQRDERSIWDEIIQAGSDWITKQASKTKI